jgi:hypothetical protein
MHDARLVGLHEAEADLRGDPQGGVGLELTDPVEQVLEVFSIEELHHHVGDVAGWIRPCIEHPDDVIGVDRAHRPRLALEATDAALAPDQHARVDALQRDALAGLDRLGFVDRAHPPLTQQADDPVFTVADLSDQSVASVEEGSAPAQRPAGFSQG